MSDISDLLDEFGPLVKFRRGPRKKYNSVKAQVAARNARRREQRKDPEYRRWITERDRDIKKRSNAKYKLKAKQKEYIEKQEAVGRRYIQAWQEQ